MVVWQTPEPSKDFAVGRYLNLLKLIVMISKELHLDQQLEDVIQILTSGFLIECIYLTDSHGSSVFKELILLVSNKYVNIIGEITPKMMNSIKEYENYLIKCFVAFQAREKIKKGNLFLFCTCQPENLVFQAPDSKFSPIPNNFDPLECFNLFQKFQEREVKKINEFKDGYYHFKSRIKYAMSAFMLHQVLEQTYRNLEIILMGKEKITHSIRCHHATLRKIYPYRKPVFDVDQAEDDDLLEILEEIYRATRYEDDFQISLETLEKIEQKMKTLTELSETIIIKITTDFRYKFQTANEPDQTDANQFPNLSILDDMKPMLAYLDQEIPEEKYLQIFGSRNRTFEIRGVNFSEAQEIMVAKNLDILLITDQTLRDRIDQLIKDIKERFEMNLLILNYTTSEIQQLLDSNNPLIHKILYNLPPTDKSTNFLSKLYIHPKKGTISEENKSLCLKNWYSRRQSCRTFFNAGRNLENTEEVHIKILLYKEAIGQSCLGLLEYFFDFRPYNLNMKFLYELCSSFWQFPNDIFPRSSPEEMKLFDNLAGATTEERLIGCTDQDWEEAYRYEARTTLFLEKCMELIDGEADLE